MQEQHGMANLARYMNGSPIFTTISQPQHDPLYRDLHYETVRSDGGGRTVQSDFNMVSGLRPASFSASDGYSEMKIGGGGVNGRWPRKETVTLLEVRSRLNSKFKETNHKGPLWNEVSRIMCEEHGYQRNAKKCREKFENLYKYYKRTKEGKTGRQDGKHYRFFCQLEALYGESDTSTYCNRNANQHSNPNYDKLSDSHNHDIIHSTFEPFLHSDIYQEVAQSVPFRLCDNLSLSNNSSEYNTFSPHHRNLMENTYSVERIIKKRKLRKRSWKNKIKYFINAQMMKITEKQEAWNEKVMKIFEQKEQERISREEQWRKEEAGRFENGRKFWGKQRAWMETRESVLMQAFHKLTKNESVHNTLILECDNRVNTLTCLEENEFTELVNVRSNIRTRFEQGGNM